MADESKSQFLQEYRGRRALYADFSNALRNLLEQLLADGNVKFQQTSSREKDEVKLEEKIDRKKAEGKVYQKLEEIEDLAGVRIIFYLEEEKTKFINLLHEEFGKNGIVSVESKRKLRGYRADHFILKLNPERERLAEYRRFQGLKCELQLTTVLHHAWSELEHDVVYKPNGNKELLSSLGFDAIAEGFEEIMEKHIVPASLRFAHLVKMNDDLMSAAEFFGQDFLAEVTSAKDNDSLYEYLEILEQFGSWKPQETVAIVRAILFSKPAMEKIERSRFGRRVFYGKGNLEIRLKCLKVLSRIRYLQPDDFLEIVQKMSVPQEDDVVRKEVLEAIKKFAEYDLNVLQKIGYRPHRHILDFMLAWNEKERIRSLDFVEVACKELLATSAEGRAATTPDTLTVSFGAVQPTDFLKKIRRDTVDFLISIYSTLTNERDLLRVVKTIHRAFELPHNVKYSDDLEDMVMDDVQHLIPTWSKLLFDENGCLTCHLSIAEEIHEQLARHKRGERYFTDDARFLLQRLLANKLYQKAFLLAGNDFTRGVENDFKDDEEAREQIIDAAVAGLSNENIQAWIEDLNAIARSYGVIETWQYQPFSRFLQKMAKNHPELAQIVVQDALLHEMPLARFCADFLHGFRRANRMDIWDSVIPQMVAKKDIEHVKSICWALMIDRDLDVKEHARPKDIQLLGRIAQRIGDFDFPKEQLEKDYNYHHVLVNALTRNLAASPEILGKLLIDEIIAHPEISPLFVRELHAALIRDWLKLADISDELRLKILNWLVTVPNLDWDAQEIAVQITDNNAKTLLEFFLARIEHEVNLKEDENIEDSEVFEPIRYEAIPYHFNPGFQGIMENEADLRIILKSWLEKMTDDWSVYNYCVSKLLGHTGKGFHVILQGLLDGGDVNIGRAVNLISGFDRSDFDTVLMIAQHTENDEILSRLSGMLTSTGVVSGEDGIAKVFEKRAVKLMEFANDPNEKFRNFATEGAKMLKQMANHEYVDAAERKEVMKIKFES